MTWQEKAQAERGRRGWSYAELARRCHEDPENMRRWLLGMVQPREGVVGRIAAVYGWPLEYMYRDNLPYPPPDTIQWARMVLAEVRDNEDAVRIASRLKDPAVVAWLVRALEQYDHLRATVEENARRRSFEGHVEP